MKKFTMMAMAFVLVFALVVPAMAETTVEFSGYYRVRGWSFADVSLDGRYDDSDDDDGTTGPQDGRSDWEQFMAVTHSAERVIKNGNGTFGDDDSVNGINGGLDRIKKQSTSSYFDNNFQMEFTFNVNDNVKLDGGIDGFNGTLPDSTLDSDDWGQEDVNITMEHMYMTITTGIGRFIFGVNNNGGLFGNDAFNSGRDVAKFQYAAAFGNFALIANYEKGVELDSVGSAANEDLNTAYGNEDYDPDEAQWRVTTTTTNIDTDGDGVADADTVTTTASDYVDPFVDGDYFSDSDVDQYSLVLRYANDMIDTAFLLGYARSARSSEDYNSDTAAILNNMVDAWEGFTAQDIDARSSAFVPRANAENNQNLIIDPDYDDYDFNGATLTHVWTTALYFNLTLGNFRFNSEFVYAWGEQDWDDPMLVDADIETYGLFLSAGYNFGIVDLELGWIYAPGQDHADDFEEQLATFFTATNEEESDEAANTNGVDQEDEGDLVYDDIDDVLPKSGSTLTAMGYNSGGIGNSFGPLFLMTGDGNSRFGDLNGQSDFDCDNNTVECEVARAGVQLVYLTAAVTPMENLTLNFAWGTAWTTADRQDPYDPFDNFDEGSSYGWEVDAGLSWQIMDNLTYHFQFAYWDLGSAWDEINRETWANDGTNNGDTADSTQMLLDNDEGPGVLSAQFRGMQTHNHDAIDDTYVFRHGIQVDF